MRLFGWKAARGSARPVLTRAFGISGGISGGIAGGFAGGIGGLGGGDWPSGYEAQVRAAYLGNAVAQRAVRIVAEGAGGVSIDATGSMTSAGTAGADHPVAALLAGMNQPLIETVAAQLLLHGDAFVQILADADGMPAMLFALRPERVTIEPDATGWPAAYVYRAGGQALRILVAGADGRPGLVHTGLRRRFSHRGREARDARLRAARRRRRGGVVTAASESALLARLVEQGRHEGADLLTIRAIAEEASELGASRALERLGLADARARSDLDELRELLSAWRDAKRTARDVVVGWVVRVALAALMLGLAVRLGLIALVRQGAGA